jgi:hypothetical protein
MKERQKKVRSDLLKVDNSSDRHDNDAIESIKSNQEIVFYQ